MREQFKSELLRSYQVEGGVEAPLSHLESWLIDKLWQVWEPIWYELYLEDYLLEQNYRNMIAIHEENYYREAC